MHPMQPKKKYVNSQINKLIVPGIEFNLNVLKTNAPLPRISPINLALS